jgi:broad specificity phosphatase PhoE
MQERASMKRILGLFVLVSAIGIFAQTRETSGTLFLVRHAEKVSEAQDALLSRMGRQRAACLAQTLRDAHIGAIYVTQVKRTQQTAEPLAKSLGIEPIVVKADDTAALVSKVRQDLSKENVLVVGHSDTLPAVLSQFKVSGAPAIDRNDYDLLFVVSTSGEKPELTTLHYCPFSKQPAVPQGTEEMRRMR